LQIVLHLDFWEKFGVSCAFVALSGFIALLGTNAIGQISKVFTLATTVPFLIYVTMGFASASKGKIDLKNWLITTGEVQLPYYSSVLVWVYSGYDYAGFLAAETVNPTKTYPRVMGISVALNMAIYLFPIACSLAITTNPEDYRDGAFPKIADSMGWGKWIGWILVGGALVSNFGVYQVYLHTSSTALYSMSLSGDAPYLFAHTLPKFETPWVAILFFSITTAIWCLLDFVVVVEVEAVLYCLHVVILVSTFFRLRWTSPEMARPFRFKGPAWFLVPLCIFPCIIALTNIIVTNWFEQLLSLGILVSLITCFIIKKQVAKPIEQLNA